MTAADLFIPTSNDLKPFAAELWLMVGIAANLLIPFATRRPNYLCAAASLLAVVLGIVSLFFVGRGDVVCGPHFGGLLNFDSMAFSWKAILLLFVSGVILMWMGNTGRVLRQGDAPEFFVLLLGATLGMCLMAQTTNLLMIFMSIAMASLPSYLLAGFRKASRSSAEAALKYVLIGALTGAIMIYGISFLYGTCGTLDLSAVTGASRQSAALTIGLFGLLVGIAFKVAAVPVHFWCPDVFEGAEIEVTTFLSVASKGAALVLLLRLTEIFATGSGVTWVKAILAVMGMVTCTIGNTAAFTQQNIKRLLAYSSIAQAGYMLCLIAYPGENTRTALLFYLAVYAVMNLGAFAIAAIVIRSQGPSLSDFAGLARWSPVLGGCLVCCLVSLIGLPPFGGFGAKLNLLWVLIHGGGLGIVIVSVIVANTALSAFYYLRVVRMMYFQPAGHPSVSGKAWARDPIGASICWLCAFGLFFLFFAFGPLYTALSR